ncbi:hypothetical protein ACFVY9_00400 [Streptomyces sp. NPDC059544]|uniref:hypothetical protein n=1 Tax=Streptomyces sp. NPDC059544 TaxID=3346861 RepID=UPI0036A61A1C
MKLVTRAAWGARAYRTPNGATPYSRARRGVKVHYLGSAYEDRPHTACAAYVRKLQDSHMDGNGWSDIGYSFLVCTHGYVYEGRGLKRRNSANGNTSLNEQDYAVCALLGSSGLTKPTDAQLHGIRDAIDYCRIEGPAGTWIGGHRDGYATACPGDVLYAWVKKGAPRPASAPTPSQPAPTAPASQTTEETHVTTVLDENNANDVDLTGGQWTLLALPDVGGVIVTGPAGYDVGVHLSLTGLAPGTRVQGRFHWYNGRSRVRSDRRPQYAFAADDGTAEFRYTDAGELGTSTDLRFEVNPDSDCTLIHRAITGTHWNA